MRFFLWGVIFKPIVGYCPFLGGDTVVSSLSVTTSIVCFTFACMIGFRIICLFIQYEYTLIVYLLSYWSLCLFLNIDT